MRLWNLATGCCLAVLAGDQGHRDEVLSAAWHLGGERLVSGGMDNTVKIWSLATDDMRAAVRESYAWGTEGGGGGGGRPFRTRFLQFPEFSTQEVHQV